MICERKTALIVAWVFCAAALTGCGEPTVTPSVSISPSVSASDTPSPSPTPLMPAGYDPSWTENQLAAVRVVDEYVSLVQAYRSNPDDFVAPNDEAVMDIRPLEDVAAEPALSLVISQISVFFSRGLLAGGRLMVVNHVVNPEETTADGLQQITLQGCLDTSELVLLDATTGLEIIVERPFFLMLYTYTVQWVSEAESWRVVLVRGGGAEC
jgi:hypothetical protein